MNKEVIKAMKKKVKKKNSFHKWWCKNRYKINRVIFFPVWVFALICKKITNWLDSRQKWNEERAKEILNYYIPRKAEWVENEKEFYFFDNGFGWNLNYAKKYVKRKDRRFWKKHIGWCGGTIRLYLINEFQLEGFEKIVISTEDSWTEISFKIK